MVLSYIMEVFRKMAIVTIVGTGIKVSSIAFTALENSNEVRLFGTHLDR